jgi:hypothetical protein
MAQTGKKKVPFATFLNDPFIDSLSLYDSSYKYSAFCSLLFLKKEK